MHFAISFWSISSNLQNSFIIGHHISYVCCAFYYIFLVNNICNYVNIWYFSVVGGCQLDGFQHFQCVLGHPVHHQLEKNKCFSGIQMGHSRQERWITQGPQASVQGKT